MSTKTSKIDFLLRLESMLHIKIVYFLKFDLSPTLLLRRLSTALVFENTIFVLFSCLFGVIFQQNEYGPV